MCWCVWKIAVCMANSLDPDQMLHCVASDQGLQFAKAYRSQCNIHVLRVVTVLYGHSLKAPQWAASDEYLQYKFLLRNRKVLVLFWFKKVPFLEQSRYIVPDRALLLSGKDWYFSYCSIITYVLGTYLKHLFKALLMSTHDICFCGEIRNVCGCLSIWSYEIICCGPSCLGEPLLMS